MPANVILINGAMEFIVADSKMDELLKWLREDNEGELSKPFDHKREIDIIRLGDQDINLPEVKNENIKPEDVI